MIQKVDPHELPGRATKYNNLAEADIREFIESEWPVAEVKTDKYKSVGSAYSVYRGAAMRIAPDYMIVTQRSGRLFLMRK